MGVTFVVIHGCFAEGSVSSPSLRHNRGMGTSLVLDPALRAVLETADVSSDCSEAVLRVHRGMDRTAVWTIAAFLLHTTSLDLVWCAPAGPPESRYSIYGVDGWTYLTFQPKVVPVA